MLRQRVATATVLLILFLVVVFYFPTSWFAAVLAILVLFGGNEWWRLSGLDEINKKWLWLSSLGLMLVLLWLFRSQATTWVISLGVAWWLSVLIGLWMWPEREGTSVTRLFSGVLVLLPCWSALIFLHGDNRFLLTTLFLIVWLSDTGAFFVGRTWGRRKLAPVISPGKTIEGMVGGIVLAVALATILSIWFGLDVPCWSALTGLCVLVSFFSVVGDLWESKMKRAAKVKDSGALFPGHGGVLDRIDSVTAAAPLFVAGFYGFGQYAPGCIDLVGRNG